VNVRSANTAPSRGEALTCRLMQRADWPAVERIYAAGILGGNATFDAEPPSEEAFFAHRIPELSIVAETGAGIVGWAAASPVSSRPVYSGVVEHSVYVAAEATGRGVAGALLASLAERARTAGYWSIQSAIFPENTASIALHRKAGFREVGRMERIARASHGPFAGRWRDTLVFQLRL
jgi:phosphinothricin acetyltransferase